MQGIVDILCGLKAHLHGSVFTGMSGVTDTYFIRMIEKEQVTDGSLFFSTQWNIQRSS